MARALAAGWAGLALAGALGGCAATDQLTSGASRVGSTFGNLLSFGSSTPGPTPAVAGAPPGAAGAVAERPVQCPSISVLDGTASYRTYVGTDQSNGNVRYQFSMGEVARECTHSGKDLLLKVGVEGRVILGPAGSPGSFTVPVRIAVKHDADGKAAAAKFYQVPATIGTGEDSTGFQVVSEPIAVPFVTANADDDYTILVGFDANAKAAPAAGSGVDGAKKGHRRGARAKPAAPQG